MRDDFTYSFSAKGRHDLRTGGEFLFVTCLRRVAGSAWVSSTPGAARPAHLEACFPIRSTSTPGTWRRSPRSCGATPSASETYDPQNSKKIAAWAQDDWQITDRLTLNLGVRYDVGIGIFANDISFPPFQEAGRPDDWNNVQPRLGFAYRLNDRTVIRGGSGIYYGDAFADAGSAIGNTQIAAIRYENDRRPDFAANPTNGRPVADLRRGEPAVLRQQQQCARMSHP